MPLKGQPCWVVNIHMDDAETLSFESMGQFVSASKERQFEAQNDHQLYSTTG
jgi:hypothetical protein